MYKYVIVLMVLLECKTEKRNSHSEQGQPMELVLRVRLGCGSLSNTTPVSLLTNESTVDVRSVLHGQMSFAAVNQVRVIHGAMNGCKNLKIHVNICK